MRHLALLLFLGLGLALEAPDLLEVQPGAFLSLPVRGEGRVVVTELPPGLTLLTQELEGQGVLNFLVGLEAPAGEHPLGLRDSREERRVRVRVLPRPALELRVPPGGEGVEGETLTYTLLLRNGGNARDRVRLQAQSLLPFRLLPEALELGPGETAEVRLELRLVGRNRDTATITAYSGLDPQVRAYGVVETSIRPFAGAEKLSRQALLYTFGLTSRYSQGGFGYGLGLGLRGALSDYVRLNAGLTWDGQGPRGGLELLGEGFALGFQAVEGVYRLEGELGPWQAYLAATQGGLSLGGGYRADPWRVLAFLTPQGQRFSVGYAISLEEGLTLTPYGVAARRNDPEAFQGGGGVEVKVENRHLSLSGRLEYLEGLRLRLGGASRAQEPLGVRGEVAYEGGGVQGSLSLSHRLDEAHLQTLSLRLAQTPGLLYSLSHRPPGQPFSLAASLGYQGGFLWGVGGRFREGGLEVEANLQQSPVGLAYGVYAGYGERDFRVLTGLVGTPEGRRLLLQGQGSFPPLEASLGGEYDLVRGVPQGQVGLLYREGPLAFGLEAAYRQGNLRLQALGSLTLRGGVDTPEALVQAFGGRATGYVEGVVFHDRNRDGIRNLDEPPLPGTRVRVGVLEGNADGQGRYRLELYPGTYRLEVGGLEASLALRRRVEVRVEKGRTLSVDLPVETVVGLFGQGILDQNRNGQKDEGDLPLPYVRIRLQGPENRSVVSDGRGFFAVGGLLPGRYTLSLDPDTLDKLQEAGEPLTLELQPGPMPQVVLMARPVVREVVRTFTEESLGLVLLPLPPSLPPGAELLLKVQVQGRPKGVWAELGGRTQALSPLAEGLYGAYLPVEGTGAQTLRVWAEQGPERAETTAVLVVRPGPLATLAATPALVDPGEEVRLEARLLRRAERVEVRLGPLILPLQRLDDLTYQGKFLAPRTPGAYELELYLDGNRVHSTRIRVRD